MLIVDIMDNSLMLVKWFCWCLFTFTLISVFKTLRMSSCDCPFCEKTRGIMNYTNRIVQEQKTQIELNYSKYKKLFFNSYIYKNYSYRYLYNLFIFFTSSGLHIFLNTFFYFYYYYYHHKSALRAIRSSLGSTGNLKSF